MPKLKVVCDHARLEMKSFGLGVNHRFAETGHYIHVVTPLCNRLGYAINVR